MKCYVSCLCLCYLTILSVWTTLSGTDGQRHDAPVTIAKQIHCHIVGPSQIIVGSNVFEATPLLNDKKPAIINYKILISSNQLTI